MNRPNQVLERTAARCAFTFKMTKILSVQVALDHVFDWFDSSYEAHGIWFGREEYGGERDILLLPCELVSLDHRSGFL